MRSIPSRSPARDLADIFSREPPSPKPDARSPTSTRPPTCRHRRHNVTAGWLFSCLNRHIQPRWQARGNQPPGSVNCTERLRPPSSQTASSCARSVCRTTIRAECWTLRLRHARLRQESALVQGAEPASLKPKLYVQAQCRHWHSQRQHLAHFTKRQCCSVQGMYATLSRPFGVAAQISLAFRCARKARPPNRIEGTP